MGQPLGGCQHPSDKLSTQGPLAMLLVTEPGIGGWSVAAELPDVTLHIKPLSRGRGDSPLWAVVSLLGKPLSHILSVHTQLL